VSRLPTVALLGTGLLGRAIAERIQRSGLSLIVYNRTASKAQPLADQGITVASRPEHAIAAAGAILLVLTDAAAIRSLLFQPACTAALSGKTIIQMGTIGPDESRRSAEEIERFGGAYLEAPVLGSLAEAKAGTLFIMVGGAEEQFARWNPLFRCLGREPRLIGPVGKAAALKLALNHLIAAEISAFALSLGLVQRSGVPVDTFMAILRESALFAPTFEKKLPRLLARDYGNPNFPTGHLLKDVNLVAERAAACGLSTATIEGLRQVLERAVAHGLGDVDYSALYEVIDPAETLRDG